MTTNQTNTGRLDRACDNGSGSAAGQRPDHSVQELRNTVGFMDCLSQGGFSEISSIARLALSSLKSPGGYGHLDDIANALLAISGKAEDIQNCINSEAERVGCNYQDDDQRLRWDALRAFHESGGLPES